MGIEVKHKEVLYLTKAGFQATDLHEITGDPSDAAKERFRKGGGTRYFTGSAGAVAATTLAITANRLYAMPFLVPTSQTFDRIAIRVTIAAGTNARMGIYADDGSVAPGALILDSGAISTASTGVKEVTINNTLGPGALIWLALVADGAPTIRAVSVGAQSSVFLGLASDLGTAWGSHLYRAFSYAALPNPFGSPTIGTSTIPGIFLRKA